MRASCCDHVRMVQPSGVGRDGRALSHTTASAPRSEPRRTCRSRLPLTSPQLLRLGGHSSSSSSVRLPDPAGRTTRTARTSSGIPATARSGRRRTPPTAPRRTRRDSPLRKDRSRYRRRFNARLEMLVGGTHRPLPRAAAFRAAAAGNRWPRRCACRACARTRGSRGSCPCLPVSAGLHVGPRQHDRTAKPRFTGQRLPALVDDSLLVLALQAGMNSSG